MDHEERARASAGGETAEMAYVGRKVPRTALAILTDVQNGLARLFRERTAHLGVSRAQWRVLSAMSGRPGATQTELADLVGIGRAPLGKIVDQLEALGWVQRRHDPTDRRVNRLYLTRDVRPVVEPTRGISDDLLAELLEDLPERERDSFYRALLHMHRKLGFSADAQYMSAE